MRDFQKTHASRQDVNRIRELYRKDNNAGIEEIKQLDLVSISVDWAKDTLTQLRNKDPKRAPERKANSDRMSFLRNHYDTVSTHPNISQMKKLASSTNSTLDKVKRYFIDRRAKDTSFDDQKKAKKADICFLSNFYEKVTNHPSCSQYDDLQAQLGRRGSTYIGNNRIKLTQFFATKRRNEKQRAEKAAKKAVAEECSS